MENPQDGEYGCSGCDFTTQDQAEGARHANATTKHLVSRRAKPSSTG